MSGENRRTSFFLQLIGSIFLQNNQSSKNIHFHSSIATTMTPISHSEDSSHHRLFQADPTIEPAIPTTKKIHQDDNMSMTNK